MEKKRKGNGSAGGGLQARIKGWNELVDGEALGPRLKVARDGNGKKAMTFHKPGSQNRNKGGRGR